MADTRRSLSDLLALLANNYTGDISAQDLRDVIVSALCTRAIRTVATNATLTADDEVILADAGAGQITLTLPAASSCAGKTYTIKRINVTNNVIIASAGGTIDGAASLTISAQWLVRSVVSDGTNWYCDLREDW